MRRLTTLVLTVLLVLSGLPRPAEPRPAASPGPAGLTVVSLNLAMRDDVEAIVAELAALGGEPADVVLLQEVVQAGDEPDVATRLGARLGLASEFAGSFAAGPNRRAGLGLLSRYPLHDVRVLPLRRFDLAFRSRHRIALGATIDTPAGPMRLYNVHLDTRINLKDRLTQLSTVIDQLPALDDPVIVGGDFNSNDNRWLFHAIPLPFLGRQSAGLLEYMESLGFRSAFGRGHPTHDALGMQLDWLFMRGLHAAAGAILPVKLSDHHALRVSVLPGDARRDAGGGDQSPSEMPIARAPRTNAPSSGTRFN
jgi:endonuclease/exonuclease/phosphatase family metal-dependent hydrolase